MKENCEREQKIGLRQSDVDRRKITIKQIEEETGWHK